MAIISENIKPLSRLNALLRGCRKSFENNAVNAVILTAYFIMLY
jgi:hypothetical protein